MRPLCRMMLEKSNSSTLDTLSPSTFHSRHRGCSHPSSDPLRRSCEPGDAGDAALDLGGRALRAESDRGSALMSITAARSLSLCESTHPVKGRAWRHRLLRAPGMSTVSAPPRASSSPGMLDEPAALAPLRLVLVRLLSALDRLKRDDLLLGLSTGLQLAWCWPSGRWHISELLDQCLVQFNAF